MRELHDVIDALNRSLREADKLLDEVENELDPKFLVSDFEIELSAQLNIAEGADRTPLVRSDGRRSPRRTATVRLPTRSDAELQAETPNQDHLFARIKLKLKRHQ